MGIQRNQDQVSSGWRSVRWWRSLAILTAMSLLFTPVASMAIAQDDVPAYYSDTMEVGQTGGTLRFLLYEDPNTLNAVAGATTIANQVITAITEGLTENDPDGNYLPILAADLPSAENGGVSEDLLTIT